MMLALSIALTFSFGGHDVPALTTKDGESAIFAHHMGLALGLSESRDVGRVIREDKENEEGLDWRIIEGDELAEYKRLGVIDPHQNSATLVYEGGQMQYLMTSRVPAGAKFRRKLKREVWPAIRQGRLGIDRVSLLNAESRAQEAKTAQYEAETRRMALTIRETEANTAAARLTMRLDRGKPALPDPDIEVARAFVAACLVPSATNAENAAVYRAFCAWKTGESWSHKRMSIALMLAGVRQTKGNQGAARVWHRVALS